MHSFKPPNYSNLEILGRDDAYFLLGLFVGGLWGQVVGDFFVPWFRWGVFWFLFWWLVWWNLLFLDFWLDIKEVLAAFIG